MGERIEKILDKLFKLPKILRPVVAIIAAVLIFGYIIIDYIFNIEE